MTKSCGTEWGVVYYRRPDVLFGVTNNGSRFVAVGTGLVLVSDDGLNWSKGNPPRRTNQFSITYGKGKFVAVGSRHHIATSSNGFDWKERRYIASGAGTLWGVVYGDDIFLAVGEKGQVLTSTDGISWALRSCNTTERLQDVTYGDGKFVAAGVRGGFYLSTDRGMSWTKHGRASTGLICVTYGNGRFVAGGREGIIYTSDDGITWTKRNSGITTFIRSITYSPSGFIAVGARIAGTCMIMTSRNGINWTLRDSRVNSEIMGVSASHNMVVAVALCFISVSMCAPPDSGQLVLASPLGGEEWSADEKHKILWSSFGPVGKVKIEYSIDNGDSWYHIADSTANDGTHPWVIPNQSSTQCLIRISDAGNLLVSDTCKTSFTIVGIEKNTITLISPNGKETLKAGSTHNITWTGSTSFSKIDIEYNDGTRWNVIVNGIEDDGIYSWKVPEIDTNEAKIWIKGYDEGTNPTDYSDDTFTIYIPETDPPVIVLSQNRFDFSYIINGAPPDIQTLLISNAGEEILNWQAETGSPWINISPTSGTGEGSVTISIDVTGLSVNTYTGTITISDPNAENSPRTVEVYLTIKDALTDEKPFGSFDTPKNGSTGISGSIAVTGWALDDKGIESVKIYCKVQGSLSFIGDAVFVEGARPDVKKAYPDYPNSSRAGWGYMLLTNFLPDGKLVLKAIAIDNTGHRAVLGTKTIYVDNANATKPFGAIDTPAQGGEASGSKYRISGWALTPPPNKIPENGSTIIVFIDDQPIGKVNYNIYRKDIAQLFPDCANSNGAMGYLDIDTTVYKNGVHTLSWSVTDNAGNTAGIGSRYFTIRNNEDTSNNSARAT